MFQKPKSPNFILTINKHQCKVFKNVAFEISEILNQYITDNKISNNYICEIPNIKKHQYSLICHLFKGQDIEITDENYEFFDKIEKFFIIRNLRSQLDIFQNEFNGYTYDEYQESDDILPDIIIFEKKLFNFSNDQQHDLEKIITFIQKKVKFITDEILMFFIFSCSISRHNFLDFFVKKNFFLDQFISFVNQGRMNDEDRNINDDQEYLFVSSFLISKNLNDDGLLSFNVFQNFDEKKNDFYLSKIIREDDVNQFQSFLISHESYLKNPNLYHLHIYNCCNELENFCDLLKYSSFFGSLKIFKFLYLNKYLSDCDVFLYAVAGGNNEIIRICESYLKAFKNNDENIFLKALKISIIYHRNQVFEWILNNNQQNIEEKSFIEDILKLSIKYTNFEIFYFLINSGILNFNQFLIKNFEKFVFNSKNEFDFWAIHLFLAIVKKETRQSLLTKNLKNGLSPLGYACEMNNTYFFQILFDFNECKSFNLLERKNSQGKIPLQVAIEKGNADIIKNIFKIQTFVTKILKNKKINPIFDACNIKKSDIVKIIIDEYDKIKPDFGTKLLNKYDKAGISYIFL